MEPILIPQYMPCGVKSQNSVARPLAQLKPPASSSRGGSSKEQWGPPSLQEPSPSFWATGDRRGSKLCDPPIPFPPRKR